jgi:hypothetical protein
LLSILISLLSCARKEQKEEEKLLIGAGCGPREEEGIVLLMHI